jgi:hypothetical protein
MMQAPFSCAPATMRAIEATLSVPRLARYMTAANGDPHLALRLYLWNARVCEAFYLPCQIAEVACRNAIIASLIDLYGLHWNREERFRTILPHRLRDQLDRLTADQRPQHGNPSDAWHVVPGLTLGFWTHLLTKSFDFTLWKRGVTRRFPHVPPGTTRGDLHLRIDQARVFRNRIAHHEAIFDKRPTAEHNNLLTIVGWICPDTQWLLAQLTDVPRAINIRPRQ